MRIYSKFFVFFFVSATLSTVQAETKIGVGPVYSSTTSKSNRPGLEVGVEGKSKSAQFNFQLGGLKDQAPVTGPGFTPTTKLNLAVFDKDVTLFKKGRGVAEAGVYASPDFVLFGINLGQELSFKNGRVIGELIPPVLGGVVFTRDGSYIGLRSGGKVAADYSISDTLSVSGALEGGILFGREDASDIQHAGRYYFIGSAAGEWRFHKNAFVRAEALVERQDSKTIFVTPDGSNPTTDHSATGLILKASAGVAF